MSQLLEAAVAYAGRGIAVFPLQPREKKPFGLTTGLYAASADPDLARARWRGEADLPLKPDAPSGKVVRAGLMANVGIATGSASGFWVLDLDGSDAEAALQALTALNGALPETVEQSTGKGRHLCFAWDAGHPVRNSAGKIGPKIDVRGDGGYIVAPPSIHPSGRRYAWSPGRAPEDLPFAPAPDWLLKLAAPPETPAPAAPRSAHVAREGRASRYGEACLATACRQIAQAPAGRQQSSLWGYACFVGGLVAGREVDRDYARAALIDAGLQMVPGKKPWLRKDVESHVDRGLDKGALHPRTAPELQAFRSAGPRRIEAAEPKATPAETAIDIRDARALWTSARPADCGAFRTWLKVRGLEPEGLPGALGRLRAHSGAPLGGGKVGPAVLAPLMRDPEDLGRGQGVDALAILPLFEGAARFTHFVGPHGGKACPLVGWPAGGAVLVAIDLQDAWALGSNAHENGHALGVAVAPTIRSFAGEPLGDRWGRINPLTPMGDPENAPWTDPRAGEAWLAVRGDLKTPPLKYRRRWGGTAEVAFEGEDAARFWGGLAEQAWRRAGANAVRILKPAGAAGFNAHSRSVAA